MGSETQDKRVLVLGGGRFGCIAVQRLGPRVALVVEPEPSPELKAFGAPLLVGDGITAAAEILEQDQAPYWLVPALPRHFLMEWLMLSLKDRSPRLAEIPRESLPKAAMIHAGRNLEWYLSLADFRCPDDCPEPAGICSHTGLPRGVPMHERLAGISLPGYQTRVLRSRQLAPGVGGLPRPELLELRDTLRQSGDNGNWIIGTACRCHGVVQALRLGEAAK